MVLGPLLFGVQKQCGWCRVRFVSSFDGRGVGWSIVGDGQVMMVKVGALFACSVRSFAR